MKYSALTWVKGTIDESLKQTRQALEQFVENSSDTAPLQQCAAWLHEIRGALGILELQTAAMLVQNIELSIKTLLSGKIENNEVTYDILMRSLVQLPNYLDHLLIIQQDIPVALLPLLNNLRALRKQPALTAAQLFTPDISVAVPHLKGGVLPNDKLKEYVLKMRAAYQKGLTVLIKNPKQPTEGLKFIYTVMQRLQQATGSSAVSKVWWVTESILEALLQKGLELNNALVNALKQIDALLKQIVEHGGVALRTAPKPLLNNLLYFAAHARSKGKMVTEVKTIFKLYESFPSEAAIQAARLTFSGPDIELMKTVITLLKDDFARVEETLDIFNRADNPSVTDLEPLVMQLKDMANTLGLLGLNLQRKIVLKQSENIQSILDGKLNPKLDNLLDIANELLNIAYALDILSVQGVHARQRLQGAAHTDFSETPQFSIVLNVVVNEAKIELAQVIQPIVTFIDEGNQDEELLEVPNRLKQVEGFLSVLSHDRAAELTFKCNHYVEKTFIKESTVPPEDKQKALADAIVGLELYLDTLAGNPMDTDEILNVVEKRLKVLTA